MKQTVKDGQTLTDVAVQEYGAWEAVAEIARQNDVSMTDVPTAGSEVVLPDGTWNRTMESYCKANQVSPATARNSGCIVMRIFDEQFNEVFE